MLELPTLHISNTLLQDLLKDLRVLKLLPNLGDDAFRKLLLLTDLHLPLIPDPRI